MLPAPAILAPPLSPAPPRGADLAARLIGASLRSSAFVSACAVALAYETSLIAGVAPQPASFYAFVLLATWASYRLHKLRPSSAVSRTAALASWAIFAGSAILALTLPRATWPAVALLAILAWAYSRPLWPGAPALRSFGVAKILTLTGAWTIATTYLPLADRPIDAGTFGLLVARRFLFMLTLCVAFDLRDLIGDARLGIRTVAVRLGVARSILLMRLALLGFVGLVALGPAAPRPIEAALVVSAVVTWLVVEATRRARPNGFYLGFVDGMMLLQALLVWASLWVTRS